MQQTCPGLSMNSATVSLHHTCHTHACCVLQSDAIKCKLCQHAQIAIALLVRHSTLEHLEPRLPLLTPLGADKNELVKMRVKWSEKSLL